MRYVGLVACAIVLGSSLPAHGERVLDEFVDAAQVTSPEMHRDFVYTQEVGGLSASRGIRIIGLQANPVGTVDADVSRSSAFTADIPRINPNQANSSRAVTVQSWYSFESTDLTENGANDALLIDFLSVQSAGTSPSIRVFVTDDASGRWNNGGGMPIGLSESPVTVAVPFATISEGHPDFSNIRAVHFSFTSAAAAGDNELDFRFQIDKIRVGKAIPEPRSALLLGLACGWAALSRRRSRLLPKLRC